MLQINQHSFVLGGRVPSQPCVRLSEYRIDKKPENSNRQVVW